MHALKVLLCWVWMLLPLAAAAQDPLHRRWTTADGLPSDQVYCGLQDREGYLWFATDMGVARFNGRTFETYGPEAGFTDPEVIDMVLDRRGRIWFLMNNGGLVVRDTAGAFRTDLLEQEPCTACLANSLTLAEDSLGRIWQGGMTGEVRIHDLQARTVERILLPEGTVSLFQRRDGGIGGVDPGFWYWFDDTEWTRRKSPEWMTGVLARSPGNDPHAVLQLTPSGVWKWDGDARVAVMTGGEAVSPEVHERCFQDQEGTLWLRRRDHGIDQVVLSASGEPRLRRLFDRERVNTVFTDRSGGHWYCTEHGVVQVLRDQREVLLTGPLDLMPGEVPTALLGSEDGTVVFGTSLGRLFRYAGGSTALMWPPSGVNTAGRVRAMVWQGGDLWLATDETLARLRPRPSGGFDLHRTPWRNTNHQQKAYNARSVVAAPDGRVLSTSFWVDVVVETHEGPMRTTLAPDDSTRVRVYTLAVDEADRVWHERDNELCTTAPDGVACTALGDAAHIGRITDILPWSGDTLLVGTSAAGVLLVHQRRVLDELPLEAPGGGRVVRLVRDGGRVWAATEAGIASLTVAPGRLVRGKALVPAYDPRALVLFDLVKAGERLVAATSAGILDLPVLLRSRELEPPVAHAAAWSAEGRRFADGDTLDLLMGRDRVRIRASALALESERPVEYGYTLDEDGPLATTSGEFELSSLPEGMHTVRVFARYAGGPWSRPALLQVRVSPPWYRRTAVVAAFWSGAGLLLAGLVLGLQQARHRRRLRALAAERALNDQRARIAADLHDDLGADLSHLLLRTRQLAREEPGSHALHTVEAGLQEAIVRMDEVIWSVAPGRDTLQDVAEFVEKRTVERLEAAGVEVRVRLALPAEPIPIAAEHRRDLSLMLKEVVANIVKHAGASRVELSWKVEGDRSEVVVDDDGRGLPAEPANGRHGLANLEERARRWRGSLRVGPSPLGGTRVELRTSLSPLVQNGDAETGEKREHRPERP